MIPQDVIQRAPQLINKMQQKPNVMPLQDEEDERYYMSISDLDVKMNGFGIRGRVISK